MSSSKDKKEVEIIFKATQADATLKELAAGARVLKSQLDGMKTSAEGFAAKKKEFQDMSGRFKNLNDEIKNVKPAIESLHTPMSRFKEIVAGVFTGAVLERGLDTIKEFGKESIMAFAEAEEGERKLLFALNGRADVQRRLIKQAEELQKKTIYEDDVIIAQQAFLAAQGHTEEQIRKTIDAAVDLAAVTGGDLESTVRQLSATYEGKLGKGLTQLDSRFKGLSTSQLENGVVIDMIAKKYKGFAEDAGNTTLGALAKMKNQWNDFQEGTGKAMLSFFILLKGAVQNFTDPTAFGKALLLVKEMYSEALNEQNRFGAGSKELEEELAKIRAAKMAELIKANQEYHKFIQGIINEEKELVADGMEDEKDKEKEMLKIKLENKKRELDEELEALRKNVNLSVQQKLDGELEIKTLGLMLEGKYKRDLKAIDDKYDKEVEDMHLKSVEKILERRAKLNKELLDAQQLEELNSIQDVFTKKLVKLELEAEKEIRIAKEKDKEIQQSADASEEDKQTSAYIAAQKIADINLKLREGQKELTKEEADNYQQAEEEKTAIAKEESEKRIQVAFAYLNTLENVFNTLVDMQNDIENAALAKEKSRVDKLIAEDERLHDERRRNLDTELEMNMLSKAEHDRQVSIEDKKAADRKTKLEADLAKKEKKILHDQAVRAKEMALFQAIIAGALAVVKALATEPTGILAIATGIAAGVEIAAISAREVPELADGGYADVVGAKTKNRYKAMLTTNAGGYYSTPTAIVGEAGGEYVISAPMLQNPAIANVAAMLEGIRTSKTYANGGYMDNKSSGNGTTTTNPVAINSGDNELKNMIAINTNAVIQLNKTLQNPPTSIAVMSYQNFLDTQKEVDNILKIAKGG